MKKKKEEETISRMQRLVAWNCASRVELIRFKSN